MSEEYVEEIRQFLHSPYKSVWCNSREIYISRSASDFRHVSYIRYRKSEWNDTTFIHRSLTVWLMMTPS